MRAKDIAFVADVLANEVEYAAPGEAVGMLAATGAIRASIVERQPDADVTELLAIEGAQLPAMPSGARPGDYVTVTFLGATLPAGDAHPGWESLHGGAAYRKRLTEDDLHRNPDDHA